MQNVPANNYAWAHDNVIILKTEYNKQLVEDSRNIPGRRWDGEMKVNTFPFSSIIEVRNLANTYNITLAPELQDSDVKKYFTDSGKEFQVEMDGDSVTICFNYDPKMITAIKSSVPSAKWNGKSRSWLVPKRDIMQAIRFALLHNLTIEDSLMETARNVMNEAKTMREASESLDADIEIPGIQIPLLAYQKAGVAYLKQVRKGILGDQPGLGKTAQAIATLASEDAFPAVVVCPNTLKINWEREIKKFFPNLTVSILNGGKSEEIEPCDVIVVNYDILYQRNKDIMEHGFVSLIVDESHAIKNGQKKWRCPECDKPCRANTAICKECGALAIRPRETWTVKRTDAVMKLAKSLGPENFVLLLTGTPITNRPEELIPQLEAIGQLESFGGVWRFKNRYAPKRNVALNTKELNEKMRETCFVRRNKMDVYGELPELRNAVQYLSVSTEEMSSYKVVEDDVVEYFAQRARDIAEEEGSDGSSAYWEKKIALENSVNLVRITALRDAVSKIKFESTASWLDNFLESGTGEKVIVFAEHIEMVEKLYARYQDVAVKIRGGVSVEERQNAVDSFQNDPKVRVFVANMTAASEGLTLTAASDVVFCELGWTPAIHEQCASRCYGRVNDMHGATAWYLLAPETIDEDMYRLLDKKKKVVNSVTDGVDVEEQGSIIGELVKTLAGRGMSK